MRKPAIHAAFRDKAPLNWAHHITAALALNSIFARFYAGFPQATPAEPAPYAGFRNMA
jgi:hypothetical protein